MRNEAPPHHIPRFSSQANIQAGRQIYLSVLHDRLNKYTRVSLPDLNKESHFNREAALNPREYRFLTDSSLFEWRAPPWQLDQFVNSIDAFNADGYTSSLPLALALASKQCMQNRVCLSPSVCF